MHNIDFGNSSFKLAILIKTSALNQAELQNYYLEPMNQKGIDTSEVCAVSLTYDGKKPSAAHRKTYLNTLLPMLGNLGVEYLLCADGEYFKTLTKQTKVEPSLGYVLPCAIKGHETLQVIYLPNYQSFFYAPENKPKLDLALNALKTALEGISTKLGANALQNYSVAWSASEFAIELQKLHHQPVIAADIEAFSLKHYKAGIGSIGFAWDKHSAFASPIDLGSDAPEKRQMLKTFFEEYKGIVLWHNASYDVTVLVYELYMDNLLDKVGMLKGLSVMLRGVMDTQLLTYLATNNCAGNTLGLKPNAYEYLGNYAEDVKDIRKVPLGDLLVYNAKDCIGTIYIYEKYLPVVIAEEQLNFYEEIFRPALHDIIEMQLVGMCLDLDNVYAAKKTLEDVQTEALEEFLNHPLVLAYQQQKREEEVITRNAAYKKKVITIEDATFKVNLNSNIQMAELIYETLKLPVLDTTKTGAPSVAGDTLKKLVNHTKDVSIQGILKALLEYLQAGKILTTFISVFIEDSIKCPDGSVRIYGSFKLGGTVSARLSSSNPNIQQIPSGSKYGKLIKGCFIAPPNYVYVMSDFSALEDIVNTLLTRDPAKEKILLENFDGHMYRAMHFWAEKFQGVDLSNPEEVNSYCDIDWSKELRGAGKAVHFSQQYLGTWATLVNNCGFEPEEAKQIEARYQNLYKVSFQWVDQRIQEAAKQGYATAAFGLRIRTPLLKQVVLGNRATPTEAAAEGRTLGNAVSGQSYCLLNGRASAEFMQRVRASEYRYDIHLCAQIHQWWI